MSSYKHIRDTIINEYKEKNQTYKDKITKWSSEPPIVKVDRPSNLARARKLGYKAKEGVSVIRVGISKGRSKRKTPSGGRKPSKSGRYFTRAKSMRAIAEERAARRFANQEVLNSYFIGDSGLKSFFEVILLDINKNTIKSDPLYSKVVERRNRVYRGLTSAGQRHRGLSR
jgi:large subunit ribosomal protein L15e